MSAVKSVLVIGGKLLGLYAAIQIKQRFPTMDVTLIEKSSLMHDGNKILENSATLPGTKTLHTGTYYTHRGHSRGQDPNEKKLLVTLTEETCRDYKEMMELLKTYGLEPPEKDTRTLYLMFNDAFVEPYYFENITNER